MQQNTTEFWLKPNSIIFGRELKNNFLDHVSPFIRKNGDLRPNFYKVKKPLNVFKKAWSRSRPIIVALTIPVGATIYAHNSYWMGDYTSRHSRKMRASRAFVHSCWYTDGTQCFDIVKSSHTHNFVYAPKTTVVPAGARFSYTNSQCEAGIHFFMNFADAYKY